MKWDTGYCEQLVRDALNPERRNIRKSELMRERRLMLIIVVMGFLLMMGEIFWHGQPLSLIVCVGVFASGLMNLASVNGSLRLLRVIQSIGSERLRTFV